MNHLLRELAPINEDAWASIEDEAKSRLTTLPKLVKPPRDFLPGQRQNFRWTIPLQTHRSSSFQ